VVASTLSAPQAPELLRPSATHRHPPPVEEFSLEVPTRVPLERADMVEVHDVCAMDANETLGIESLFEPIQRKAQRVAGACGMGDHVITVGLEPRHLRDQKRYEAASRPNEQSADRPAAKRARQPLERATVCRRQESSAPLVTRTIWDCPDWKRRTIRRGSVDGMGGTRAVG
jgi:hypothetical protein